MCYILFREENQECLNKNNEYNYICFVYVTDESFKMTKALERVSRKVGGAWLKYVKCPEVAPPPRRVKCVFMHSI